MKPQWWYAEDNNKKGPIREADLQGLHRRGEISDSTLVWQEGMVDWAHFGEIDSLKVSPSLPPELPVTATSKSQEEKSVAGPAAAPSQSAGHTGAPANAPSQTAEVHGFPANTWHRYFARMIDLSILSMVLAWPVGYGLGYFFPAWFSGVSNDQAFAHLFAIVVLPFTLLAEGVMYGIFGNTPGKKLLKIRLIDTSGNRIGFRKYMARLPGLYAYGLGLGIPLITIATMLIQKGNADKGEETAYDRGRCLVRQPSVSSARAWAGGLTAFGILIGFSVIGAVFATVEANRSATQASLTIEETLEQAAQDINKRLPKRLDEITVLDSASVLNRQMVYHYTIEGYTSADISQELLTSTIKPDIVTKYCTGADTAWYRDNDIPLCHVYGGDGDDLIGGFTVSNEDC